MLWKILLINPFQANVPILYPLKTPENQRLSGVFRGYKIETLARNGLKKILNKLLTKIVWEITLSFSIVLRSHFKHKSNKSREEALGETNDYVDTF